MPLPLLRWSTACALTVLSCPDGGRRRRVSQLPHRFDHAVWAILIAHVFFNCAVVVRVGGLEPRPTVGERAVGCAGGRCWRSAAAARPRSRPQVRSVPVHLHVVRRRAAPRCRATGARGRDHRQTGAAQPQVAAALAFVQLVAVSRLSVVSGWVTARSATTHAPPRQTTTPGAPRAALLRPTRRDAQLLRAPVARARRTIVPVRGTASPVPRQSAGTTPGASDRGVRNSLVFVTAAVIATVISGLASIAIATARLVRRRPDAPARRSAVTILQLHRSIAPARPARRRS